MGSGSHTESVEQRLTMDDSPDWSTYCSYPFFQITMKQYDGDRLVQSWPCCNVSRTIDWRKTDLGDQHLLDPQQLFDQPSMVQLRQNLLSGIKDPQCQVCWRMEDQLGIKSYRQGSPGYHARQAVPLGLTSVDIRTSNLCNLRCRMCYPTDSHSLLIDHSYFEAHGLLDRLEATVGRYSHDKVSKNLDKPNAQLDWLMANTDQINMIRASGGEPFYDQRIIKLLQRYVETGAASNTTLRFNTNGTLFTDNMLDLLGHFNNQHQISVDGTAAVYEYIRFPQRFHDLEHSIRRYIQQLQPDFLTLVMTVSALNVLNINQLIDWANSLHDDVHVWFAEVFSQKRGTSLYRMPPGLLELAKQRLLPHATQPNSNVADQLQRIQSAIDNNREDLHRLREEIMLFDQARDQRYADYLDPQLVAWLDSA